MRSNFSITKFSRLRMFNLATELCCHGLHAITNP